MRIISALTFAASLLLSLECSSEGKNTFVVESASAVSGGDSLFPDYNTNPIAPDASGMESTAMQIATRIRLGWNLGNALESIGGETNWGNPLVANELIQLVKSKGFDAIRIPVSWDQYANTESAAIDVNWLNRIKEVVQYCIDNDLYAILNIHWDGGWLENHVDLESRDKNNAKQKAFWQQIATHFRDFDERVMFASANEPDVETPAQMQVLRGYHQTFIDAVRATGGRNAHRVLVVQGPSTDIEKTHSLWTQMPADTAAEKLMFEVHFYTPYNFTLMKENQSWGQQFYYWGYDFHSATDSDHNATWGEEETVDQLFDLMKRQFVDKGIPVVLGEFAAMRRDNLSGEALERHLASRAHYLGYVTQQANARGLMPFYWDNGAADNLGSGIFNRWQNTVIDQQTLTALVQGAAPPN